MKAIWKDTIIAESDATIEIENNHYFPLDSVRVDLLSKTETRSICPWKGEASYYSIHVNGETNKDAGWFYPQPKEAAQSIKNYVAFWKGVQIEL